MDPATIAGLVLGVVPLLISVVENYEVTFQPFVTYRRHVKEVQRFTAKLEAQRAIFHNECQLLLLNLGQNLTDILRDPNHSARNDKQLSQRLQELLGSSYSTCITTLNLINDTLDAVTLETKGFGDLIEKKKSKGKSTLSMFRQKIKISFSKNRLTDIVNELREYNEDLARLSNQIRKLASDSIQPTHQVTSSVISHLQITQQASSRLYNVLSSQWACDDRVEHTANMFLDVKEQCQHAASQVRFDVVVTCIQPALRCIPLWLVIESVPSDGPQEPSVEGDAIALKHTLQKMGARSSVRFALSSSMRSKSKKIFPSSKSQQPPGAQINLCTMGRLCQYFRQVQSEAAQEPCLGFLEEAQKFKHFVYRHPLPSQPIDDSKSVSLKQILHMAAEEDSDGDWIQKLRLARLLALAVLRFHGTEWLPESWGSKNVRFIGHNILPGLGKLAELACLNAKLSGSSTKSRKIEHPSRSASSLALNETLFSLGIVLIELGYNSPFESLSTGSRLETGANSQVADFIAARRLGESVHKKLNKTYGRLVEKCLNCNFGVATQLDDTELQAAVVVQVVNQLDICLEQYREFNSLAPLPVSL